MSSNWSYSRRMFSKSWRITRKKIKFWRIRW